MSQPKYNNMCKSQSSADQLLKNLKQLHLWNLGVSVFVDCLDELCDFLFLDLPIAAETLEGIADETENFTTLKSTWFVCVVFGEDRVDGLT